MSMERCMKCCCPSTLVDTDYNVEIYRYGIEWGWRKGEDPNNIRFTGNDKEATPLCEECLSGVLEAANVTEEYYMDNFQ